MAADPDPQFFRVNEVKDPSVLPPWDRRGSGPVKVVVVPDLRAARAFWATQEARALGKLDGPPPEPSRN